MPKLLGRKHGTVGGDYTLEKKGQWWNRVKSFSETFYVMSDSLNDFEDAILACPGLPVTGDIVDGCALRRKVAKETDTIHWGGTVRALWEVELFYDSRVDPDQMTNADAEPTNRRPKRRWRSVKIEERMEKDVEGTKVQTQADEEIVIMDTVVYPLLEIERYENYPFDPQTIRKYTDKCNLETFYGAPPGCALIESIDTDEEVMNRILYEKVVYQIRFGAKEENVEDELSTVEVLHQGYKYRDAAIGANPLSAEDKNGVPIKVNLFYDPLGPVGSGGTGGRQLTITEGPSYIPFKRKKKIDFGPLNLEYT